ncbi:MAG: gliding motility-associated C-terminal domain-containing protein, partial [Bacteroidia bacterium]|nr:gliding motility-associated C-terminal domain-containing protein [Bacteroidia bacterium]
NTDSYEYEILEFDWNFPPEIVAPMDIALTGCETVIIDDPPYSETPVDITEEEFSAIGGSVLVSNAITSLTYQDIADGECPITITRTFTIIDACDISRTDIQIITIEDEIAPEATNPADILVSCLADIPPADISIINATDNCSVPIVTFVSDVSNDQNCPETIIRTYRITDNCGNFIEVSQNIIVNDDILPTATSPADINVQCIADIPIPDINIITDEADNCSMPSVFFVSDVSDGQNCPETIIRTYRIMDACNNSIDVTQNIIVNDDIPPTASNPVDINVQCVDDVPDPDISIVTDESDNCSAPLVTFVSDVSDNQTCPQIITRTYRISDACNNFIEVTQNIIINDDIAPTASNLSDVNLQCIEDLPPPDIALITDETDNCSVPTVAFVSDVSSGITCPETITRTYSVSDDCGNSIEVTQNFIINDDIVPTASDPAPIILECGEAIPAVDISVVTDENDNCSIPTVIFISDVSDGMCPETITRTYEVHDECGNSINVSQQIIFEDTTAPTLLDPIDENLTVNCDEIPDVPQPEFEDECSSNLTVNYIETDTNDNNTVDYDIIRQWEVTDECGNTFVLTQNIRVLISNCIVSTCNSCGIVDDTIAPTASNPADLNVDCADNIPPPDPQVVTDEADNCTPPEVFLVSEVVSIDCLEKVTRVYRVMDECGNFVDVTHIINVIDDIPPTASNPDDINVSCIEDIPPPNMEVVTDAADNCSIPVVSFVSDISNNTCEDRITRTYRVTDGCGNYIDVTQTINVIDDIAPTASIPEDINVACVEDIPPPNINVITDAADNCSTPSVEFLSEVSINDCLSIIQRTYRITDSCGNFTDVVQTINVVDDVLPTASAPENISVQCIGDVPSPDIALITDASDNCSAPTVSYISDVSDGQSCPETITRTYRVTDFCGNYIDLQQAIIINDDIAPTASNLSTENLECIEELPDPNVSLVTDASDNCSVPEVAFVSDVSDDQSCSETITRTYSVTDDCGNTTNVTQLFVINDITAPTASGLPSVELECIDELPSPNTSLITDAQDNCSIPVVEFVSDVSNNESCSEIITRTYRITDSCGNSTDILQSFTVVDSEPTASPLQNITLNCPEELPEPDVEIITDESDNCGIPSVRWVNDTSRNEGCSIIVTRIYRLSDSCGNNTDITQEFTIVDDIAPSLTSILETELTVSCDKVPEVPILEFEDNCSTELDIDFQESIGSQFNGNYDIQRTWTVTDSCDNQSVFSQLIHMQSIHETYRENLTLCITDDEVDLNSLLSMDNTGNEGWTSESLHMLEEGTFITNEASLNTYYFQHVRTENSCSTTTNVILEVNDSCVDYPCIDGEANVEITKMVTPNGDGINDFFEVVYIISELSDNTCDIVTDVKIFNRWGTRVYHSNDYQNDWDGYSPGS